MSLTTRDFDYLREMVRERSAIVLKENKEYLVKARLAPLLRRESLGSLGELVRQLRSEPKGKLGEGVVEAMTTNETSFFRDNHPFEALRTHVFPDLAARRSQGPLNVWCAACSSGQEPYSIAMTVREHFPELQDRGLQILGTDLSNAILAKAREGRYRRHEIKRGLPVPLRDKYFDQKAKGWQVRKPLRDMVDFRPMNLVEPWTSLPSMHVVFLRNVLIYFDTATKRDILAKVRRVLRPGGYLFLGSSETTLNLDDTFERVALGKATGYRLARKPSLVGGEGG